MIKFTAAIVIDNESKKCKQSPRYKIMRHKNTGIFDSLNNISDNVTFIVNEFNCKCQSRYGYCWKMDFIQTLRNIFRYWYNR